MKAIAKYVLTFLFLSASVAVLSAGDFPEPQGWVNDFAGVLSQESEAKISGLIDDIHASTSVEIVVVTVNSTTPEDEFSYSQRLFDQWKIGKKGKDNGVLILISTSERRWRIHTGYGVEEILPDVVCSAIGRDVLVGYLKKNDYSKGLYETVLRIAEIIALNYGVSIQGHHRIDWEGIALKIMLAVIFVPVMVVGLINFLRAMFIDPQVPFYPVSPSLNPEASASQLPGVATVTVQPEQAHQTGLQTAESNGTGPNGVTLKRISGIFIMLLMGIGGILLYVNGFNDSETWKLIGFLSLFVMGFIIVINGIMFFVFRIAGNSSDYEGSRGKDRRGDYDRGTTFGGGSSGGGGAGGKY